MRPYKFGVTEHDPSRTFQGFTLFTPSEGKETFLIDMVGQVAHKWDLATKVGNYAQLLPTGNLLVSCQTAEGPKLAAAGGRLLEMDWDGNILWEHTDHFQHHDFNRCPNGNTAYLAWELIPTEEAGYIVGGIPGSEHEDGGVYCDVVREVNPAGEIVFEWRMMDHFPFEKYPLRANRHRHEFAHANTCFVQQDGNFFVLRHLALPTVDRCHGSENIGTGNQAFFDQGAGDGLGLLDIGAGHIQQDRLCHSPLLPLALMQTKHQVHGGGK